MRPYGLLLLMLIASGCGGARDDQAIHEEMPRLSLTPLAQICVGGDEVPCQFVNAALATVAPDGRVAVADIFGELREFGRDGQFVRTVGARGGGPGEYRRLVAAGYDGLGRLTVLDQSAMRVQRFDGTGTVDGTATAPFIPGLIGVSVVHGKVALFSLPGASAIGDTVEAHLVLVDPASGDTSSLPGLPEPAIATGDGSMFPIPPLFTVMPIERWAVSPDGAFHLADRERLRIVRRDRAGGTPVVLVDLAVAPRPVTDQDIEAALARRGPIGPPGNTVVAAQLRRQLDAARENAPRVHPLVTRLVILDDGTLLARGSAPPGIDSVRWNAFSAEGDPVGYLLLSAGTSIAAGRLERMLLTIPDADDVPRIGWYGVRSEAEAGAGR